MTDLIGVVGIVAAALQATGIRYSVGGSIASSMSGEPRASIDADIVTNMEGVQIQPFIVRLGDEFYADADALARAVTSKTHANVIHQRTGIKVDIFVAGSVLDRKQLERRRPVRLSSSPAPTIYVHSPEDILLQKLHWYRIGGEVSDRQWRDVCGILLVQGPRIDRGYLDAMASIVGVSDLLERAIGQTSS